MQITLEHFLNLRFRHEYHDYHQEGTKCLYQDLIKQNKTIREFLFILSEDSEYFNIEKYQAEPKLKYDHMTHYIYCMKFGFLKNIIAWREEESKHKLIDPNYYASKEVMDDDEIQQLLIDNPITVDQNYLITGGYHRCFCMMGRLLRADKYIPLTCEDNVTLKLRISAWINKLLAKKIANVGYRTNHNVSRLKLITNNIENANFSLVDIGSNYGYFSLSLAKKFANSWVYSVEGSYGTGNEGVFNTEKKHITETKGIQTHRQEKEVHQIYNNSIFCTLLTAEKLQLLHDHKIVFDYQLSLSVFHWVVHEKFENSGDPESIYELLCQHLTLAKTTFLELPDFNQETSMSPAYANHKDFPAIIRYLNDQYGLYMQVELLGEHKWYGKRSLYKITNTNIHGTENIDKEELLRIFRPIKVL